MASSMAEYLKRYQSDTDNNKKKTKKKKPKPTPTTTAAILVVDQDPIWHKPITIQDPQSDSSGEEETPLVEEDIEVKRMRRMELIRARKPYNSISEDGSGWVSVAENTDDGDVTQGRRMDTPSPVRDLGGRPPRPPIRKRLDTPDEHESNAGDDLSPPRKRASVDLSPPRRRQPASGDLSPPRRRSEETRSRELTDNDLSPPRRRASVDMSPPRRRQSEESTRGRESHFDDLSPPRRREMSRSKEGNVDLSPPRKRKKEGPKTGLLSAKELREENVRKKKEEQSMYAAMDPSLLGKNAEPVFRREGKRISKEELLKAQQDEKPKETKLEWGQGLAQKRDAESMAQKLELEKDKPFARTRDDPDLDRMLKERLRWGDPMAHLVKQKHSEILLEDLGDDEKMKESGFIVPQTVPTHSWIKRGLEGLPNRYGIRPGRHWDGVDRSTGYEKELFKRQNEKRATETEAYMWSVSDM